MLYFTLSKSDQPSQRISFQVNDVNLSEGWVAVETSVKGSTHAFKVSPNHTLVGIYLNVAYNRWVLEPVPSGAVLVYRREHDGARTHHLGDLVKTALANLPIIGIEYWSQDGTGAEIPYTEGDFLWFKCTYMRDALELRQLRSILRACFYDVERLTGATHPMFPGICLDCWYIHRK